MNKETLNYLKKVYDTIIANGIDTKYILDIVNEHLKSPDITVEDICKKYKIYNNTLEGYCIDYTSGKAIYLKCIPNHDKLVLFKNYKEVRSAIALAKISQIIANDDRFGGAITDEEWDSDIMKYTILRVDNNIETDENDSVFRVLAFHTPEQRDAFLEEYIKLIKEYLML